LVTPGAVAATAGLDDVIGHDEVKRSFEETFVFPLLYPDLFKQSGLKNKVR
jgi:SpoVK/Ycf46/Vps4 family AAA+-type ATPase